MGGKGTERETVVVVNERKHNKLNNDILLKPASRFDHDSQIDKRGCWDERKEREMLVSQIVELQSTLRDLSHKVDNIKLENMKLRSDNEVLVHCIENLVYDFNMPQ
ncbi:unnamed protein product [Acanthoscelides obtectus]|uniref:Uncharacterized protein n=1 Tax=Acanthoscelides obtectus TaxID=200917 RepID=A0A9P0PR41_ACAOB|nr:unnamed protein product [Acanthoscelides obtectus]CAK1684282.1 Short coiled-coil protein homolog [Acanthoscelides obtectus]